MTNAALMHKVYGFFARAVKPKVREYLAHAGFSAAEIASVLDVMTPQDCAALGDDGEDGEGMPGMANAARNDIEVGIAPSLPLPLRAGLLRALREIKAAEPHFYHMVLFCAHSYTIHNAYYKLRREYDALPYLRALADLAAYNAAAGQPNLARFTLDMINTMLVLIEKRPDVLQRWAANIMVCNDLLVECVNAMFAQMLSPTLNASQMWTTLMTISANMKDIISLRAEELGAADGASVEAMVHAAEHDEDTMRALAEPFADELVAVAKMASAGEVQFDLFDARAYGYSLLLGTGPCSVEAYRVGLAKQLQKM
jgi:hypothetical protein